MICKAHFVIFFIVFVVTNTCLGYIYDTEPQLVSSDYRLAAMGNLDLVTEFWDNEINAYDFGESPAGIISDNKGRSTVYLPLSYGKTQFADISPYGWDGYSLSGLCGVKFKSKYAIGVDLLKARGNSTETYDFSGASRHYDTYDGLLDGAYQFSRSVVAGFRFEYNKEKVTLIHWDSISEYSWDHEIDIYQYIPSILIQPTKSQWQVGFNYRLLKLTALPSIHDFVLPVFYSSRHISFGAKAGFGTTPFGGEQRKYLNSRMLWHIPNGSSEVNIGLLFNVTNPIIYDELRLSTSSGWQMDLGLGIAYARKKFGLIGIQYVHNIKWYDGDYWYAPHSWHENHIHVGSELRPFSSVPIRLGYINVSYDDPYPYYNDVTYDIITAGCGIEVPKSQIVIDFAYNLKFFDRTYYDPLAEIYIEKDHLFGLSGRFFW